jgi:hypothetical protein
MQIHNIDNSDNTVPIYYYLRDLYHLTLLFFVPFINIIIVIIVATQVEFSKISIFRRDSGEGTGIVHTVSDRGATEEQLCSCVKLPEKKYYFFILSVLIWEAGSTEKVREVRNEIQVVSTLGYTVDVPYVSLIHGGLDHEQQI